MSTSPKYFEPPHAYCKPEPSLGGVVPPSRKQISSSEGFELVSRLYPLVGTPPPSLSDLLWTLPPSGDSEYASLPSDIVLSGGWSCFFLQTGPPPQFCPLDEKSAVACIVAFFCLFRSLTPTDPGEEAREGAFTEDLWDEFYPTKSLKTPSIPLITPPFSK